MEQLKLAVIGAGYWGKNLVRVVSEAPNATLHWVSDPSPAALAWVQKRYPLAKVCDDPKKIIDDPEVAAVVIATPVTTHAELAVRALEAGKHVLVEKPMTATAEEALKLIDTAEKKNLRLMVGHVFHYKPEVRELVRLNQTGELGNIKYLDSTRINLGIFRKDVNVLWDLAPHDLSIFEAIMGRHPKRVSAIGAKHVSDSITTQDTMAYLILDYGEDVIGHIHVNWFSPVKQRLLLACGDKRMAVYDDISQGEAIRVYDKGVYNPAADSPENPVIRAGDTYLPCIKQEEPLKRQFAEFIASIVENRRPQTDGYAGLRVLRILEAAMMSIRADGKFVELEPMEEIG